jgi:hypothetical protein
MIPDEYDRKIAGFLGRAFQREQPDPKLMQRRGRPSALEGHDYYLLVMLQQASPTTMLARRRSLRGNLIYLGVGIAIAVIVAYFIIIQK